MEVISSTIRVMIPQFLIMKLMLIHQMEYLVLVEELSQQETISMSLDHLLKRMKRERTESEIRRVSQARKVEESQTISLVEANVARVSQSMVSVYSLRRLVSIWMVGYVLVPTLDQVLVEVATTINGC